LKQGTTLDVLLMCFVVKDFSSEAAIRSPEQQTCEGDPLAGRT